MYKKGKTIGNYLVKSDIIAKKIQQLKIMHYTDKKGTFPVIVVRTVIP